LLWQNYPRIESRFSISRRAPRAVVELSARSGFELGFLVNFSHYPKLEYERIAKTQQIKVKTDFGDLSL
jgi:hypothetical protein